MPKKQPNKTSPEDILIDFIKRLERVEKELMSLKRKVEHKTIGGFNDHRSPLDMGLPQSEE